MTNQKKKDHYVYQLVDITGVIRYIGQGRGRRYKSKNRTSEYLKILEHGGNVEIILSGLTREESLEEEKRLIDLNKESLLNRSSSNIIRTIQYEYLNKFFRICENSPSGLVWKFHRQGKRIGTNAGSIDMEGYYRVQLENKVYKCHRIVWALHNEKDIDSDFVVDHVDGNKSNNDPSNLHLVSIFENNIRARWNSNREPTYSKSKGVYIASVTIDGKCLYRSYSVSKYGADVAYTLAKEKLQEFLEFAIDAHIKL